MSKIDIETVENKILEIIQANFNNKIAEINTDKGDSLLTNIDKYMNNFYEEVTNYNQFIFYSMDNPVVTSNAGAKFGTDWEMIVEVFLNNTNNETTTRSKIYRYTRALYEIVQENQSLITKYCSLPEISALAPQSVTDINNETPYQIGGIRIKININ